MPADLALDRLRAGYFRRRHRNAPNNSASNTAGCDDSNSTATSVPVGKNGSEPVTAMLRTTAGPNSRDSVLSGSPSCRW